MRNLLPIDESPFSQAAVAFVASRSALIEAGPDLELINVQYAIPLRASRALGKQAAMDYQQSQARHAFKPALAVLKRAGLVARVRLVIGNPGVELGKVAASEAADLIVMGSHGHTGFKRLLFGSVTSTVLASCNTPLLVVRDTPAPRHQVLSVGIALDGSRFGLAAVRYLLKHRDLFGGMPTVFLIHVVPDIAALMMPGFPVGSQLRGIEPTQVKAMQAAAFEQVVTPARRLLQAAGLPCVEVLLVGNNAGDEIASTAAKRKLSMLMLGSHGLGGFRAAVLGSVATRVTVKSRIPLLFVRGR